MLSCNSQQQQQPLNSNENRYIPHRDREQYNNFGRGNSSRTKTLTTQVQQCPIHICQTGSIISHTAHLKHLTQNGNSHFQNQTYHAPQIRDHATNNAPFRLMNILQEQQGFYQRGSPRSDSSLYGTFPCEACNNA